MNYVPTVWDGCSEVHLNKQTNTQTNKTPLNSLHRRAAELILSDLSIPTDDKVKLWNSSHQKKTNKKHTHTKKLQVEYNKAVMMFKVTSGEIPLYIRSLFTRSTRRYTSNNFIPPCTRTDLYKTSLRIINLKLLPAFHKKVCDPSNALKDTCINTWVPAKLSPMPIVSFSRHKNFAFIRVFFLLE